MPNKLYRKAYDFNKSWWHEMYNEFGTYELDHLYGRVGIRLCCPILFQLAPRNHHDHYQHRNQLKEAYRKHLTAIENNVIIKGERCDKKISWHCDKCYFFNMGVQSASPPLDNVDSGK